MSSTFTSSPSETSSGHVHSSICIDDDGKAMCACDKLAQRLISHTSKNPDRPFYVCATSECSFWKWESDLLGAGLIPPVSATDSPTRPRTSAQVKSPLSVPKKRRISPGEDTPPSTPPKPTACPLTLSPMLQTPTPARRVQGHSISRRPRPGPSQQRARDLSPGARARRLANIEAALQSYNNNTSSADERNIARSSASIRSAHSEAKRKELEPNEELENVTVKADSDSESEPEQPASKRTRLSARSELERLSALGSRTPPRCTSSSVYTTAPLPTPSQTSSRGYQEEEADDPFGSSGPMSPTSFTRGGQRALERAGRTSAGLNKVKNHLSDTTSNSGAQLPNTNNVAGSLQAQLASTIQWSRPHASVGVTPVTAARNGNSRIRNALAAASPAAAALMDALAVMSAQRDKMDNSVQELLDELERLRRKDVASGKSLEYKDNRILKLQEENEMLKERNALLESFRDQIQSFTQATPPRRS